MDKLRMESPDMTAQNIDRIAALFPNCITEASDGHGGLKRAINFEMLKQMLSPDVVDGDEAYEFTWVGKKAAIVEANKPIRKTLRPCVAESKDWDTTENLYIEGDNLEVLKLLQESYLGKVKMIYIDPPYNTGNDFIYADDFMRSQEEENAQMGMYDEDENRLFKNTDTNGRFHSDWCSMIYSRLMLARNLLSDDGAIFISINDAEIENLRNICNEILGSANYVATLIWQQRKGGGNDSRYIAIDHEYILIYAKCQACLTEQWLIAQSDEYLKRYKEVDENGRFYWDTLIRNGLQNPIVITLDTPDGGKITINSQKSKETVLDGLKNGLVRFTKTAKGWSLHHKVYMKGGQVLRSILTEYGNNRSSGIELVQLFSKMVFDYSKPSTLIELLCQLNTRGNDIILDFFSGSATTAHAVMQLNAEDGGHRKFIMVQLPEPCDEASEAYKAGYKNICEIGKERIRRAGDKIKEALLEDGIEIRKIVKHKKEHGDLEGFSYAEWEESPEVIHAKKKMADSLDIGFRVLKLDDTNMKDVYYAPDDYDQGMLAALESNIKDDRTDLDLLFGCLIDWGRPLSLPYKSEQIDGCTVHTYKDGDLIACFDANIPESVVKEIAKRKPHRAVFRDSGFASSPEKINVFEIFKLYMPEDANDITKRVRVI